MWQKLARKWDFPWPIMDVLIAGKSSIDLPHLFVSDWQDATEFLISYGFDPNLPEDARQIHAVLIESINFIMRNLLSDDLRQDLSFPNEILACDDVRQLLLFASDLDPQQQELQLWSCAILRVMHTIAHLEGVIKLADHQVAFQQIYARFSRYIHYREDGSIYLGMGEQMVEIERIEWKREKSRDSMLLKLLHKPANVAESIYDLVGVRVITKKMSDVMLVVKFLRQFYMVSFANCNPTRARNTLVDVERFKENLEKIEDQMSRAEISQEDVDDLIETWTAEAARSPASQSANPHSSQSYKSIQMTCRQLVRWSDRRQSWLNKLRSAIQSQELDSKQTQIMAGLVDVVEQWNGQPLRQETTFFPFEVQIMDSASFHSTLIGDAAHDRYKRSQLRSARRRVIGELIKSQLPS